MDKNIYDKHANLMFFGNFVFADTELSDLGVFLRDINALIAEKRDNLISPYSDVLPPVDMEFSLERYEESFAEILNKSFIVALVICLEKTIGDYCDEFQVQLRHDIGWKEFRGNVLERFKTYTKKFLKLDLKLDSTLWKDLNGLFALRNCVVHADGNLNNFTDAPKIREFSKRHYLSIDSAENIAISLQTCESCLEIAKSFFEIIFEYALSYFPGEYGRQRTSDNTG